MTNKLKLTQMVGGAAVLVGYVWTTTAIVRKWPDTATWIMWATLVFLVVVLVLGYRAARSRLHNFKGGKWAAAVLLLGGDTTSNRTGVTPTQRAVGFAILMLVIFTKSAIVLIWPDYPAWVSWVEISIALAVTAFFIYKIARNKTPDY